MNIVVRLLCILLISGLSQAVLAQSDVDLENSDNRLAYSIGVNVGQSLSAQNILEGIELDAFMVGMMDAISGNTRLEEAEVMAELQAYMQRQQQEAQTALADNLTASQLFLDENGQRQGVVTLDSGLQYEILESGPVGGDSPAETDTVLAHYHGTLADGSVFDSSVERGEPASFGLSQVIAGWTEALQLMEVGDKWRLYIPPELAYGETSPTPAIPPNSALVFEVELLEIR
ncbi:MAG: FKBP-type peptidyl-prolyl cis-trans isomerase [Gammaproteobacteria bacterium]|nr:FKBP-type peptidyl-prolyl cis-trans isomerase [Gammaproteobacteria bacterium]